LRIAPVTSSNDDGPGAESSRTAVSRAARASDRKIDLTDEAHRAVDSSAGPPVSQWSATLAHHTPEEDAAPPTFENSDEELEYLRREDARLEKQREIECLRT
jgi:hypothetical protein